ncbi:MAG: hypothetical protein KDJ24_03930 [Gammaproteobacteria bacterium]|nr:hypothetical protein [Gammaproteobacteria bacterium]
MIDNPLNRIKVKRGSDLPHAKLSEDDVALIRKLIAVREDLKRQASELTNAKIAEKFGMHVRSIDRIAGGESWTHVE